MKKLFLTLTVMTGLAYTAVGQITKTAPDLSVGDQIPAFTYSKWIKGTPISDFNDGKTYVFEFWATWCGPCIAEMPHLSKIAKQYEGQVEVIGVNVWEKVGSKEYESAIPSVEKFVTASGDRMAYHVVMDNNEQHFAKNWLKPAGINGIPTTIIAKNNVIQWIGHPYRMDSILAEIVADRHDLAGFKKEYDAKQVAAMNQQGQIAAAFESAQDLAKNGDLSGAFNALDGLAAAQPVYANSTTITKFALLLEHKSETEALEFYKKEMQGKPQMNYIMADQLLKSEKPISQESFRFAATELSNMEMNFSMMFALLADVQSKAGDYVAAGQNYRKAVETGESELKDPKMEGRVFQHTIDEYKTKLKNNGSKIK